MLSLKTFCKKSFSGGNHIFHHFMSFLGELEDTFDIELEETEVTKITTLEEALKLLEELQ